MSKQPKIFKDIYKDVPHKKLYGQIKNVLIQKLNLIYEMQKQTLELMKMYPTIQLIY